MSRLERWMVWGSVLAVSLTGFVYAWMKHLLPPPDEFAVGNHPLQPLVLKLHILTAPLLVFAVGLIAARHILPHLRAGCTRAHRSGLAAALVIVPMILTGYLIQAVTSVPLLLALAWSHLVLGSVFALAAGAHAVAGRHWRVGACPLRTAALRRSITTAAGRVRSRRGERSVVLAVAGEIAERERAERQIQCQPEGAN